jgi:2-polyprenyl-3-methyl-5-hydroxy-6-metoxy-1,4-benzoquinol methylase
MDTYDHPQFNGYDKDWRGKFASLSKSGWSKGYDKAFDADVKNLGFEILSPDNTRLQLSAIQGSVFERTWRMKSVLDFGCGPGYVTAALLSKKVQAIGVDCSTRAIQFCKRHFGGQFADNFSVGDEEDVEALKCLFDGVIAIEVLEHVKDPERTIKALWDKVAPGGQLIFSVPKNGIISSPYNVREFSYGKVRDLAETVSKVAGSPEYICDVYAGEREFLCVIQKDPILIRYVQVQGRQQMADVHNNIINSGRTKTGVYNWSRIFHGGAQKLEDIDPFKHDVIHVQLTGDNFDAPRILRDRIGDAGDGKPKIVVNLDYPPELWGGYPPYPELLLHQLQSADFVFAQNDLTCRILSDQLEKAIPTVPHPVDADSLKASRVPIDRKDIGHVAVLAHRDCNVELPRLVFQGLDVTTKLFGFDEPTGGAAAYVSQAQFGYNIAQPLVAYEDYLPLVNECAIAFETYTHSVQGRSTMEMACLGIPTIGHTCVDAQTKCFPSISTGLHEIAAQRRMLSRLLKDKSFYMSVVETAQAEVEFYNFENSKRRFMEMIGHAYNETVESPVHRIIGNDKGTSIPSAFGRYQDSPLTLQA